MESDSYTLKFYHYRMPQPENWNGEPPTSPQAIKQFVLDNSERYFRRGDNDFEAYPFGGVTECDVVDNEGNVIAESQAVCSLSDNYNYHRGVVITKGRALKSLLADTEKG